VAKRFTAISAMRDAFTERSAVIVVPSELLLSQWYEELGEIFKMQRHRFLDVAPDLQNGGTIAHWSVDTPRI
jgi:superfamily II DNA or RNA helicase